MLVRLARICPDRSAVAESTLDLCLIDRSFTPLAIWPSPTPSGARPTPPPSRTSLRSNCSRRTTSSSWPATDSSAISTRSRWSNTLAVSRANRRRCDGAAQLDGQRIRMRACSLACNHPLTCTLSACIVALISISLTHSPSVHARSVSSVLPALLLQSGCRCTVPSRPVVRA